VLAPADFSQEYGTSNLDMRHSAGAMVVYEAPWKLRGRAGKLANGWMLSGVGQFRSGLPYTMRTSGSLPEEFDANTGAAIVGLGPGMNGSGGDNRVYGLGNDGHSYNIGATPFAIRPPGRPICGWAGASTSGTCASWSCWPRASTFSTTRT